MAKIYETEQDKRRDDLDKILGVSSALTSVGTSTGLMSAFAAIFSVIGKKFISVDAKNFFGGSMRKNMEKITPVFGGMALASFATAIGGYLVKTGTKQELDSLGPEEIIAPCCAEDYIKTKNNHAERLVQHQTAPQTLKSL